MNKYQHVIAMLNDFLDNGVPKYSSTRGLCHNISVVNILMTVESHYLPEYFLRGIFRTWGRFSGDDIYPITSPWYSSETPEMYFFNDKYKGRQLRMRKLLAKHIINELEKIT